MKSAMRCMPWSASSSGVSFLAPRRRILVAPFAKASEIELRPGAKPCRSALWVGTEAAGAGVEPDLRPDRPIDDDHGEGAAGCRLELLAARVGIEKGGHP